METAAHLGHTQNRRQLASRRLSVVLEVDFTSPAKRRPKVDKQGDSGVDFSDGGGESNLGAPRIHGELLKLGFPVSEPTVSRWVRRAPRPQDPAKRWLTFLRNHREAIAAMDYFTVPTLT